MGHLHILIAYWGIIPTPKYGGISRVIWHLGKELTQMGHKVSFLVEKGSYCDFARIITYDHNRTLASQIPEDVDLVHLQMSIAEDLPKPT
jgi:hypothetical protein